MKATFNTLVLTLVLATGAVALSACENTWHGAGQDIEQAGEKMQTQYDGDNY